MALEPELAAAAPAAPVGLSGLFSGLLHERLRGIPKPDDSVSVDSLVFTVGQVGRNRPTATRMRIRRRTD